MMKGSTLFRDIGTLLTMAGARKKSGRRAVEADLDEVRNAAIFVRDGRIAWVGPEANLPKELLPSVSTQEIEDVSLNGATVLPAFVECHTHLVFAGNRADEFELRNRGASYQEIAQKGGGIAATVVPTRQASLEDLASQAQVRADRFVRQGVATIEAKSGYALNLEGECKLLEAAGRVRGPRIVRTYLGPHSVPKEAASASEYLDSVITEHLPQVKKLGLATRADIFVETGYFPPDLARRYLSRARELGFDLAVHADQLTHCGGAKLAVEFKARSAEHLIQIDDADVAVLAASETTAVLLPAADLYLKCSYPPARALLDKGARIAIATDFNPGSSPTQSVSLVGVLARLEMGLSLPETLVAYTVGAAHALGLQDEIGSIEIGKSADFVALEGSWHDLFYSIGEMPVLHVWCGGRSLVGRDAPSYRILSQT